MAAPSTGNVAGLAKRRPRRHRAVVVTYDGPTDPKDRTSVVRVPLVKPRRDELFPLGRPVGTTRSTADRLAAMAGHTFTIEPARPEGGM